MNQMQTLSLLPTPALRERLNSLVQERESIISKKRRLTDAEEQAKRAISRVESEIAQRDSGSMMRPS